LEAIKKKEAYQGRGKKPDQLKKEASKKGEKKKSGYKLTWNNELATEEKKRSAWGLDRNNM